MIDPFVGRLRKDIPSDTFSNQLSPTSPSLNASSQSSPTFTPSGVYNKYADKIEKKLKEAGVDNIQDLIKKKELEKAASIDVNPVENINKDHDLSSQDTRKKSKVKASISSTENRNGLPTQVKVVEMEALNFMFINNVNF